MPTPDTATHRSALIGGPGRAARRLWSAYGGYALGFVSLFLIWQWASLYLVSSVLFPPPTIVFRKALVLVRNGVLLEHLSASLQRILAGFIAGSLLGVPIGLAMANSFTTIVAAELIAANDGLGKMLWDGRLFMLVDEIFVSLVTLGLLGFVTDRMFRWSIYTFAGKYSPAT